MHCRFIGLVLVVTSACGPSAKPPAPPSNHPPPPANGVPPPPATAALLAWPVARFTPAQIAEVKGCEIEKLAQARYPKSMTIDKLPAAFAPHGTCDEATFAAACGYRLEDDKEAPPRCLEAYRTVIGANPAFAFSGQLVGAYFGKLALVAAPPPAKRPLASVDLVYEWGGLGDPVKWTVAVRDLATHPAIKVTGPNAKAATWSPDVATAVAALGTSLGSFLPIPQPLHAIDCTDNYPEWTATLAFDDGSKLELTTNGSNLIGLGGPWQTTIGGVTYMQLSPDFVFAIAKLVKALDLAIGEPMGAMCRGYDLQNQVLVAPTP